MSFAWTIFFYFQKPEAEKLKKWSDLLRSDPTILEKFVSCYSIAFTCFRNLFNLFAHIFLLFSSSFCLNVNHIFKQEKMSLCLFTQLNIEDKKSVVDKKQSAFSMKRMIKKLHIKEPADLVMAILGKK